MRNPEDEAASSQLTERLLDLLVYAPIGLALDAQTLTPELAKRGRQHTAAARQLGELAVKRGLRRVDELLTPSADEPAPERTSAASTRSPRAATEVQSSTQAAPDGGDVPAAAAGAAAGPTAEALAIPDYDHLAASQVVKRLDGLSTEELEAVRVYESATRDRRTILHKIARLQG